MESPFHPLKPVKTISDRHEPLTVLGRTAYIYKPQLMLADKYRRAAAIFVLHGSMGVATDMFSTGFETLAEAHRFLVVYPEMKVPRAAEWGYKDDIPYFTALVHRLVSRHDFRLDAARVFVCGHSAGGSFSLYLQNQVDLFSGAAAVEAAVDKLEDWDMTRRGTRTLVVWNHADPELAKYAPAGGEPAYYNLTVETLRRHGSKYYTPKQLPTSRTIPQADLLQYPQDASPHLAMLSFKSNPGTHAWADTTWCTFNATKEVVNFFFFLGMHGADVLDITV
jgi:poly(3-hydroxybutyrate) depolymerase